MNYFFALPLPPQVREAVAATTAEWRARVPPGLQARWYAPEDCHITLKFLGDVAPARLPELICAAQHVAAQAAPFLVRLTPAGGFPDLLKPFVLWSGVQPNESLTLLASAIEEAMAEQGFSREQRPYRPHITLARCRAVRGGPSVQAPRQDEQAFPQWQTDGFALLQTLPPEGRRNDSKARYNTVHLFPFGTPPS